MLAVMAVMRFLLGFLTIPELMLNTILKVMGGQAFSDALDRLYYAGRPLLFASILEGTLLLGVVLGLVYALLARPEPFTGKRSALFNPPLGGLLYGLLIGVLLNLVFLPLVGQAPFAREASGIYSTSAIPLWLGLIALAVVYGLALQALLPPATAGVLSETLSISAEPGDSGRRDFLRLMAGALLALAGGAFFTLAGTIINQGGLTSPVNNSNLDAGGTNDVSDTSAVVLPDTPTPRPRPPSPSPTRRPKPTHAPSTRQPTAAQTSVAPAQPTETPVQVAQVAPPTDTAVPPTDTPQPTPQPPPTSTPYPPGAPPNIVVNEITPVSSFYHVSKNFFDPSPSAVTWNLSISGLVQNPYSISYNDLLALPAVEVVVAMTCVSNPTGGGLIGNTTWKGVRLADLLNKARPKKGVVKAVLGAVDGYTDSITYQKAMDPDVVLAYEMGGATLPPDHGFPARLLVPGIYGMKHVKWLNSIELVNYDYKGYWQQPGQGWSDAAPVHTMSKIDYPASGTLKLRPQTLAGVAFAGDRSISKVEVSTDGGNSWNQAYIKPKLSDTSWVVWAYSWTPPAAGRYTVIVRATDGQGNLQSGGITDPYPNGASGWHMVVYTVRS
jgi:DMSO/TMAO reductase YedYZ molybdopterin-dependent catalytic subunit